MKKAIFIDRDGTLIEEVGYLKMLEDLRFTPRATSALRIFSELGYLNIVITNQSAVARGILSPKELNKIHNKMRELAQRDDARIDHIYFCPHLPDGRMSPYNVECDCRKPKPGMLHAARDKFDLDFQQCIMVGDKTTDLEVAKNAGVRSVLVLTGYGATTKSQWNEAVETFGTLYEFALNLKTECLKQQSL